VQAFLASVLAQEYDSWELHLINGQGGGEVFSEVIANLGDPRLINGPSSPKAFSSNTWGYEATNYAIEKMLHDKVPCEYFLFTNADNLYARGFLKTGLPGMLSGLDLLGFNFVTRYLQATGHEHMPMLDAGFAMSHIDLGAVLVSAKPIKEANIRFNPDNNITTDWSFFEAILNLSNGRSATFYPEMHFIHQLLQVNRSEIRDPPASHRSSFSQEQAAEEMIQNSSTHGASSADPHTLSIQSPGMHQFSDSSELALTFITITDDFFETNLGASSLWKQRNTLKHEWLVIKNDRGAGISDLYAQAQGVAHNPLLVFVHPDVMLPDDWYANFMLKLAQLEAVDPNWAVLGTAGVPLDFTYEMDGRLKIASIITDGMSSPTRADNSADPEPFTFTTGIDNLPVQSLDEHLLVLRAGPLKFDPNLPGFDLYGTDIVLSARQAGLKSYLLNINVKHKTVDADGNTFNPNEWWLKYNSADYQNRAEVTKVYMLNKWRASKFLPVYGTGFDLLDC